MMAVTFMSLVFVWKSACFEIYFYHNNFEIEALYVE